MTYLLTYLDDVYVYDDDQDEYHKESCIQWTSSRRLRYLGYRFSA